MGQWIVLFIIVDAIITVVVIWWVKSRRDALAQGASGSTLAQLAGFSREIEPQIRDYMATFYGGDPRTLPSVLPGLASRIENQAIVAGLGLGRDAIESLIARAIAAQKLARERDVLRAFEDASGRNAG